MISEDLIVEADVVAAGQLGLLVADSLFVAEVVRQHWIVVVVVEADEPAELIAGFVSSNNIEEP